MGAESYSRPYNSSVSEKYASDHDQVSSERKDPAPLPRTSLGTVPARFRVRLVVLARFRRPTRTIAARATSGLRARLERNSRSLLRSRIQRRQLGRSAHQIF